MLAHPMIDLYTWPTPNGHKAQIILEEVGLPYRVHPIDITQGAQFDETYLALNPNNKVPTIVDQDGPGGQPYTVFESGAILVYLADKTGKLLPSEPAGRHEVMQWLMWQMGGLGPMLGQAQHFHRYAPERVVYAIERYTKEGARLLAVMDRRLAGREWLAGDAYSIADIACFPWIRIHKLANQSLENFPNIRRWYGSIRARPAVERGLSVLLDRWVDVTKSEDAQVNLFGDPQYRRGEPSPAGGAR
jgi:GSH-dependent disulfide-bond oxidoreductase